MGSIGVSADWRKRMRRLRGLDMLLMVILVWSGGLSAFVFADGTEPQDTGEIMIEKVEVRFLSEGPVVLLKVGERAIPIYVDPTVAGSIHGALSGQVFPRPLSHDLMHTILDAYHIGIDRVMISLKNGIYYATLTLSTEGQAKTFDSRSSDAIALAIHFGTPIIVSRNLLESAGKSISVPLEGRVHL